MPLTATADATPSAATSDARPQAGAQANAPLPPPSVHAETVQQLGVAALTNSPPATPAWTSALPPALPLAGVAVEIAARFQGGTNRFEIRLDPPELRRLDVRLDVDRQGNVTSHLLVERSDTLDLLRRDAPQLERALQDAGLKTGGDSLQFSLRDQGFAQNQNTGDNAAGRTARTLLPTDHPPPRPAGAPGHSRVTSAGRR